MGELDGEGPSRVQTCNRRQALFVQLGAGVDPPDAWCVRVAREESCLGTR